MKRFFKNQGFTLIEILLVIVIIGILMGLLMPAINGAIKKAKVAQAKTGAVGLAAACKAYYTEYGKWPVNTAVAMDVDSALVAIMRAVTIPANPRRIVFFEFSNNSLSTTGNYIDPWKNTYRIAFDTDYDNQITAPFGPSPIIAGVIVWSNGPTGTATTYAAAVTSW